MLPVFTTPLAFLGLLALPALMAIYLLHNRARPRPVSSLLLWVDARPAPEGGRRGARPLVVVLDDSFSMLAGDPDSPRKRAADALLEELRRTPRGSVRLVLAGE